MVKIVIQSRFSGWYSLLVALFLAFSAQAQSGALVFQTDFGLKDGAVAAMKGVAFGVSPQLKQFDLTHEIPAYNIWEAAYRLEQTYAYWPAGTVFVSVVDPGVGSDRRSVVAKLITGQFVVTPDNGTLTLLAENPGIEAICLIDEQRNRLPGSGDSYTFHGRDVYAYTGARLASGTIQFEEVGPPQRTDIVRIPYTKAAISQGVLSGTIPVLDIQYGNLWTNIPFSLLQQAGIRYNDRLVVDIYDNQKKIFSGSMPFVTTFSAVKEGQPLAYINSLLQLSFALNQASFATKHHIGSGGNWRVQVQKQRTDHSRIKDSPAARD